VTTIWFWTRSVLVTDRFWKKDAHPRDGHPAQRWTDQIVYLAETRSQVECLSGTVTGD
jgi:hypothetical protein